MGSNAGISLLEMERDRLQGSLNHLERSVKELKAAIAEEGPDQDYKGAINENVVLIAKSRARIAALDDEIKRSKGLAGDISMSELATVPVGDVDMDMQQQLLQEQQHRSVAPPTAAPGMQLQQPEQRHDTAQPANGDSMHLDDRSGQRGAASEQQSGLWL
eukprot:GHUV01010821.1.p3 GENE.GHUV01010821.1~~GHUV01010821.1.p3  ORF type:complete len:160 (+),score=41.87 GHUV01010821.1:1158-1637(+)